MPNACALNGSADKLGLTDAVGRKAGCKVGVFFLGHAGLDNTAAVGRVVPFAGHGLHFLSLNSLKCCFSFFCFFRLPDVLGTRFMPAIY